MAVWLVTSGEAISRAQSEAAQPATTSDATSPTTPMPTDAREQQFAILTQAVTALCQEIAHNNARSDELTEEQARLRARVAALRRELNASQDEDERLRSKAQALEKQLREVGATLPEPPRERPQAAHPSPETAPPTKKASIEPAARAVANGTARPEPTGGDATYHVVAPGENLFRIGVTYGIDYRELASANHLDDASHIVVGQRLLIPRPTR